ncbi:hypothetical protein K3495_g14665 [Podosphaera aphanis]|nr:hypothetical protein K3495_g14665 [Podosphaera aphanis]
MKQPNIDSPQVEERRSKPKALVDEHELQTLWDQAKVKDSFFHLIHTRASNGDRALAPTLTRMPDWIIDEKETSPPVAPVGFPDSNPFVPPSFNVDMLLASPGIEVMKSHKHLFSRCFILSAIRRHLESRSKLTCMPRSKVWRQLIHGLLRLFRVVITMQWLLIS